MIFGLNTKMIVTMKLSEYSSSHKLERDLNCVELYFLV